jgi:hypothetical protein
MGMLLRPHRAAIDAFVDLIGQRDWADRLKAIQAWIADGRRAGRALARYHAVELTLERLRQEGARPLVPAALRLAGFAADAVALADTMTPAGRERLRAVLRGAVAADGTLVPAFHLLRTAALQRERGFAVSFAGLEEGAPFDLLLARDGVEAEVVCDLVSAEAGREVHRGAWVRLADRIDPDLQTWLAQHPGRYVLKMTLPLGLRGGLHPGEPAEPEPLAVLHGRVRDMLTHHRRADHDEAVVLRLDPLLLVGAQADELGLMPSLRAAFGPEAHLSVTAAGRGVFVMAARSGREDEVAVAVRKRMAALAPARLTGTRPGILAMFVEDTDRDEWRSLRDQLQLEGEARYFLTRAEAKAVVAVTCASRFELFAAPDCAEEGELRFRNPSHPAARTAALAPAVASTL